MKHLKLLVFTSLFLGACTPESTQENTSIPLQETAMEDTEDDPVVPEVQDELPEEPIGTLSAHFTAVGDLLVERPILYDAEQKDGTFYFDGLLSEVEDLIRKGDFAYANQETPITGAEYGLGDGNFVFNNPYELGHAYYETGFNMLQLANNHTLDMEVAGLHRNVDFWRTHYPDVLLSGAHTSIEEQGAIPIIEKNGISIALISTTYNSNMPVTLGHSVNIFTENEEALLEDVARANELADLVAVGIHWGKEYQQPTEDQEKLAQKLALNGADIILGHHPHVIQPIEWIEGLDGQQTLVAYSLGNFISGPFDDRVPELDCDRLTGTLLGFEITKENDRVEIDSLYTVPTFTYFSDTYTGFKVLPLDEIEEKDFRWCDFNPHKQHVKDTLTRRFPELEVRLELEPK